MLGVPSGDWRFIVQEVIATYGLNPKSFMKRNWGWEQALMSLLYGWLKEQGHDPILIPWTVVALFPRPDSVIRADTCAIHLSGINQWEIWWTRRRYTSWRDRFTVG